MLSVAELSIEQSTLPNTASFSRKDDGYRSTNKHCVSYVLVTLIVLAALSFAIVWVIALVILKRDRQQMLITMHKATFTSSNETPTTQSSGHAIAKRGAHSTSSPLAFRATSSKLKGA